MMRHLAFVLVLLFLVACGAAPTATPDLMATQVSLAVAATRVAEAVAATLTAGPPPATEEAVPTATLIPVATATVTPTPPPLPTATSPSPPACPAPGSPPQPSKPAAFDDVPAVLQAYLSAGAGADQLESLLRSWGAITSEAGSVHLLELTGDAIPETVVSLIDPSPELQTGPWPPGDLLVFQCQAGSVITAYRGRFPTDEDWNWYSFHMNQIADVNGTGLLDVVYLTRACGAHTCFDQLYVIEWDGAGFVNRVPGMEAYPYPTFTVGGGQILVDSVGFGSVGAGIQRGSHEVWTWNGQQFALTDQGYGPPLALIHYMHDGDAALSQGSYPEAIAQYESALTDASLPNGLFPDDGPEATAVVRAYARFKLMVAWAAAGDQAAADAQYNLLLQEHAQGTPGYPFALLGQVFWSNLQSSGDPSLACAAVTTAALNDPTPAEMLYAGYGNPEYEPEGLCALP